MVMLYYIDKLRRTFDKENYHNRVENPKIIVAKK